MKDERQTEKYRSISGISKIILIYEIDPNRKAEIIIYAVQYFRFLLIKKGMQPKQKYAHTHTHKSDGGDEKTTNIRLSMRL